MAKVNRKDSKGRVLKDGESERKDGRYSYRYIDKITGKRHTIYSNNLKELREKEKRIQKDISNSINVNKDLLDITLDELFEIKLSIAKIKVSTKNLYVGNWKRYISDGLKQMKVVNVKPIHIELNYRQLADRGLCKSTISSIHTLLYSIFEIAVGNDIIQSNPTERIKVKKFGHDSNSKLALTIKQQKDLLDFASNHRTYKKRMPMIHVLLGTGIRISELCGLTENDIDFVANTIKIDHQVRYDKIDGKYKLYVQSTKSNSSRRLIPMTDKVRMILLDQIKENNKKEDLYTLDGYSKFIFKTAKGTPMHAVLVDKIFIAIRKAYDENLLKTKSDKKPIGNVTPHILRHTFCTRLSEKDVNLKVLQYLMGHKDIQTTMNIYNHIVENDSVKKEICKINGIV